MGRLKTHRNDFLFLFSLFLAFPNLFMIEKKLWWCFLVSWAFLLFFWNFLLRVGEEHIRTIFFLFSLFLGLSKPILDWKEAKMVFSNFLNFFPIFFLIYYYRSVGTHRNDVFYFLSSWPFPTYFGLKRSYDSVFKVFKLFCYFFEIFYYGSARSTRNDFFFYFLSFSGFCILFWLKKKLWYYFLIFWILFLFF